MKHKICKVCTYIMQKEWRKNNPERAKELNKRWVKNNLECTNKVKREWRINNPIKVKNAELKLKYGIDFEQMRQMYISQNGCCAICHIRFAGRSDVCVDHDHTTEKVRQLLCHSCNRMLGDCKENPQIMLSGVEYINKWSNPKWEYEI